MSVNLQSWCLLALASPTQYKCRMLSSKLRINRPKFSILSSLSSRHSNNSNNGRLVVWVHRCGDDFSVGRAKIGEKQSRQSNSKYNFMQYVFFKKVYAVYNGVWGKTPRSWAVSRIFVLKITLQSVSYSNKSRAIAGTTTRCAQYMSAQIIM